ncbi:MAG: hypothetical protein JJT78_07820 [Leptospira sp.]|nr:hypothetical protein [Leptospira sp.]
MTFIDQIVLPVFIIWFLGLVLVFFRKDIDLHWKISFLFLFIVYFVVFGREWSAALDRLEEQPSWEIRNWIYGIGKALFYFLFILWPITLIRLFYSSSKELARLTSSIIVSVTVVYWFLFWLYFRFQESVDGFFYGRFLEWF